METFFMTKIERSLDNSLNSTVYAIITTEEFNNLVVATMEEFNKAVLCTINTLADLGYTAQFYTRKCIEEYELFIMKG